MMFVPWLWICASITELAPDPSAIIAITEATPMITPSMVSVERTLLRRIARSAMRRVLGSSISGLRLERRKRRELRGGVAPPLHRLVGHHAAVRERDRGLPVL